MPNRCSQNQPSRDHKLQSEFGKLPLCRAVPAAAGARRRLHLQILAVAVLETEVYGPAAGACAHAGRQDPEHAVNLPDEFDQEIQSWEMSFKDVQSSDYVAGGLWAIRRADRFLLDQRRERLGFPETLDAVRAFSAKWPKARLKLVEDKANGPAVIQMLRREIPGLVAVNPQGGKIVRAQACSAEVESGNVYMPHPAIAPWVEAFVEECSSFPNGPHDDQVDI